MFICYLRYILLFYHLNLAIFSRVYVPRYNYHEALGHDLMLIGLKYISHFTHLLHLFSSISNLKHFFTMLLPVNSIHSSWLHENKNTKVSKGAKIRNRYNQIPHLTQDTNGKVTNSQLYKTNESQEVSPFPSGDHKAQINRRAQRQNNTRQKNIKDPQKKYRLGMVSKIFYWRA